MAGVTPADIDLMQVYDAFSPLVLWTLERFGYCPVGQAADWIQNGRIGPGGDLPLNTGGGQLSCGQTGGGGGMIGITEAVRQLRGEGGARQVTDARRGLISGYGMVAYGHGLSATALVVETAS